MKRHIWLVLLCLSCAYSPSAVMGMTIRYDYAGTITHVGNPSVDSSKVPIAPGERFYGGLYYDPTGAPLESWESGGSSFQSYTANIYTEFIVNGLHIISGGDISDDRINIFHNNLGATMAYISFRSIVLAPNSYNPPEMDWGYAIENFQIIFHDNTNTALADNKMPIIIDPSDFSEISIGFDDGNIGGYYGVKGTVDSFSDHNGPNTPVPEPSTIALIALGLSGIALLRKTTPGHQRAHLH